MKSIFSPSRSDNISLILSHLYQTITPTGSTFSSFVETITFVLTHAIRAILSIFTVPLASSGIHFSRIAAI
jgi:hypothetical protein